MEVGVEVWVEVAVEVEAEVEVEMGRMEEEGAMEVGMRAVTVVVVMMALGLTRLMRCRVKGQTAARVTSGRDWNAHVMA